MPHMNASSEPAQPTAADNGSPGQGENQGMARENGRIIWKGDLYVSGSRNDMIVPCVAIQMNLADKQPLSEASGWPDRLPCGASKLKDTSHVLPFMNEPTAQWCVKFAPVDENGKEKEDQKLTQLVRVMSMKKMAFEIVCNKPGGTKGTLYIWAVEISENFSLLGVFRPDPQDLSQE